MSDRGRGKPVAASPTPPGRLPVKAVPVSGGRHPAASELPSNDLPISWRLGAADIHGPWGWAGLGNDTLLEIHSKLAHFESMTWGELMKRDTVKQVPRGSLCPAAQTRLAELRLDDLDELWELRLGSKPRVWGWRNGAAMHLLWWDPQHKICPSKKRRT